ncbi:hypothetical protein SAMN02745775_113127 [Falsiroseomonas stagni DSM 19981]|uniref:Uncharacterized protein n=1 Tax=Falsiroseomonas stagni DSM 19981 TaxID=1123062 RepID=A0A1I4E108_9PROT|nr:hypothetical protein SAMN02745775_113127 [Falsiroseomonas stagni DSM 19981]
MTSTTTCPTCGRRHRLPRAMTPAPLPLFAWAARHPRPPAIGARLLLRADMLDADGEPRACIAIPGRRVPLAYPNLAAALAALRDMEPPPHAGR